VTLTSSRLLETQPGTLQAEAYDHAGRFLWRHDMGWAIETGIWYSPILVYDLDSDGKAEVYCKAGDPGDPRTNAAWSVPAGVPGQA